jgi:hypothetical protein
MAMVNRIRSNETVIVTTTNHSTQCTICKKFHKGECFFKNKPDTESNTKTNGSKFTVKQYANLMQSMMANATAFTPSK